MVIVDKFLCGTIKIRLTLLAHVFPLCVVSAVSRNRIVQNNIVKLQDIYEKYGAASVGQNAFWSKRF